MKEPNSDKPPLWPIAFRGMLGLCPACGKGRMFAGYLKQNAQCAQCLEPLGRIRSEDGPAWLTILIVGHVLAPILLVVVPKSRWPDSVAMAVWTLFAPVLSLVILPRAKGLFIAILWRMRYAGPRI